MLKNTVSGILAGTMISIGGTVFLSLAGTNKIIGAILFSVALLILTTEGIVCILIFTSFFRFIGCMKNRNNRIVTRNTSNNFSLAD